MSSFLRLQLLTIVVFSVICLSLLGAYNLAATKYGFSPLVTEFRVSTTFTRHNKYMNISANYDHLWNELLPPNGGMTKVVRPDDTEETYGVSMFHQLHCLQMIRNAFQDLQNLEIKNENQHRHNNDQDQYESHPHELHWTHCLDYLRQVRAQAITTEQ